MRWNDALAGIWSDTLIYTLVWIARLPGAIPNNFVLI